MEKTICIPNIESYTQEIIDGDLILIPKKKYITEEELERIKITHAKIKLCVIYKGEENISCNKKSYRSVLVDIWKSMPTQKILQNTKFNFKLTNEVGEKGYKWCPDINMSFQNKDASGTLDEIINMIKLNNMCIDLSLKLETDEIIHFKI